MASSSNSGLAPAARPAMRDIRRDPPAPVDDEPQHAKSAKPMPFEQWSCTYCQTGNASSGPNAKGKDNGDRGYERCRKENCDKPREPDAILIPAGGAPTRGASVAPTRAAARAPCAQRPAPARP